MVRVRRNRRRLGVRRGRRSSPRIPRILNADTLVYHGREEVAAFTAGNAGFQVNSLVVNMALTSQLTTLAALYSEYHFTNLRWIFLSEESQNSNLGTVYISYSNDVHATAPGSLASVIQRPLSIQIPLLMTAGISIQEAMVNMRRSFVNALDIPRAYNNVAWYRTNTAAGVTDLNSTGIVHYGSQAVASGNTPGILFLVYTVVFRSHI